MLPSPLNPHERFYIRAFHTYRRLSLRTARAARAHTPIHTHLPLGNTMQSPAPLRPPGSQQTRYQRASPLTLRIWPLLSKTRSLRFATKSQSRRLLRYSTASVQIPTLPGRSPVHPSLSLTKANSRAILCSTVNTIFNHAPSDHSSAGRHLCVHLRAACTTTQYA